MSFRLADAIFWIAVACCSIAQLAILRSAIVSPTGAGDASGNRAGSRRAAEIVMAILPGIALAIVLVMTWRVMHGAPLLSGTVAADRSEEHTSELQSHSFISY